MSFEEFLQKKNEEAKARPAFNRDEKIRQFHEYVNIFYTQLKEDWLPGFYQNLNPTFTPITIHEDSLGDYTINSLTLNIGASPVKFKPIGTILIGTPGRIDMICGSRKAMFIMTGEKARTPRAHTVISRTNQQPGNRNYGPLVWKLLDERGMLSFIDLNANVIQELIMDMVGR